ncbi:MAG: hypothetical protein AB7F89_23415 [Pirellulaceae bacterium]
MASLYSNWELLRRVDEDLEKLAAEQGIVLDGLTDQERAKKVQEIATGITAPDWAHAVQVMAGCNAEERKELDNLAAELSNDEQVKLHEMLAGRGDQHWSLLEKLKNRLGKGSHLREQIARIVAQKRRWPASWEELGQRIWAYEPDHVQAYEDSIGWFLRGQHAVRYSDDVHREDIVQTLRLELFFLVIRNAGQWYGVRNPAGNWRGFLICHIRTMAHRRAKEITGWSRSTDLLRQLEGRFFKADSDLRRVAREHQCEVDSANPEAWIPALLHAMPHWPESWTNLDTELHDDKSPLVEFLSFAGWERTLASVLCGIHAHFHGTGQSLSGRIENKAMELFDLDGALDLPTSDAEDRGWSYAFIENDGTTLKVRVNAGDAPYGAVMLLAGMINKEGGAEKAVVRAQKTLCLGPSDGQFRRVDLAISELIQRPRGRSPFKYVGIPANDLTAQHFNHEEVSSLAVQANLSGDQKLAQELGELLCILAANRGGGGASQS